MNPGYPHCLVGMTFNLSSDRNRLNRFLLVSSPDILTLYPIFTTFGQKTPGSGENPRAAQGAGLFLKSDLNQFSILPQSNNFQNFNV
jgi:hypothetical protein